MDLLTSQAVDDADADDEAPRVAKNGVA